MISICRCRCRLTVPPRVCGDRWYLNEEIMCVVYVGIQRGNSGDGCDLASTLCRHDLRNGDLFVLILARVRRVRREVSLQS